MVCSFLNLFGLSRQLAEKKYQNTNKSLQLNKKIENKWMNKTCRWTRYHIHNTTDNTLDVKQVAPEELAYPPQLMAFVRL